MVTRLVGTIARIAVSPLITSIDRKDSGLSAIICNICMVRSDVSVDAGLPVEFYICAESAQVLHWVRSRTCSRRNTTVIHYYPERR